MAKKEAEEFQTAVRIPKTLVTRIDKIAENMSTDGIRIRRAEALRNALFRGVDLLESEFQKEKKR